MKKQLNKKKPPITLYEQIYRKILEYRPTIILAIIIMIPVVFILYILNIHHYIFPKLLGDNIIFRLDIYYRYFAFILAFMYLYELWYKPIKQPLYNWFIYLFIIMTIASTILSANYQVALYGYPNRYEGMYTILFYCFLFLNCQKITDQKYIYHLIKIIVFTGFIQLLFVILQLTGVFSKVIYMYRSGDAIGLTENCNFLGSLMCMLSIVSSSLFIFTKKRTSIYYLLVFITSYITLLLANSTGPFISFIFTIIIFLIYLLIKKAKYFKKCCIIILLIVLLYPIVLSKNDQITPEIKSHINYFFPNLLSETSSNSTNNNTSSSPSNITNINQLGHGRLRIWKNVWHLICQKPLIGYGPDNLGLVYQKTVSDPKIADKAHNIYLNIWVSSGLLALIGYIGFVITNILTAIKCHNKYIIAMNFGVIAYSIQGLFNINVNEVTPYFYLIIGLMVSLVNIDRENKFSKINNGLLSND